MTGFMIRILSQTMSAFGGKRTSRYADKPRYLREPVTLARFLPLFGRASAQSNCTIFGVGPN